MAWFIDDLNQYQIYITDLWAEYYIPKFQLDEHGSLVVEEPYLHIYWSDTQKGDGGKRRHLQIAYYDVVDGYSGYVDNPTSAASLQSSIESMIVSGWVDASIGDLLTEKGDLLTNDGVSDTVLKVTTNRKQLTTDTGEATYLKWKYNELGNTSQTTDFTLALTDSDSIIECDTASSLEITVPPNSSVAFPIGTEIHFMTLDAGLVFFTPGSGVTIHSVNDYLGMNGQHACASLTKIDTNTWSLCGDLKAALDADAEALINAIGTLTEAEQGYVNSWFLSAKANGYYSKYYAVYLFVGASASAHKWNAIDPQDLDASFRMTFNGSPTHNANGVSFNGTTQYGDTKLDPSLILAQNSKHVSMYMRSTGTGSNYGCLTAGFKGDFLSISQGGTMYWCLSKAFDTDTPPGTITGFFSMDRSASTTCEINRNDVQEDTDGAASDTNVAGNIYIGCRNLLGTGANNHSADNICFLAIGDTFTAQEMTDEYNDCVTLQTNLSRNV